MNKYFESTGYWPSCSQLECWKFWCWCRPREVWNILRFCNFCNEIALKCLPFRHPYIFRMDCYTFLESFLMEVFGFLEPFEEVSNCVLSFWRFGCRATYLVLLFSCHWPQLSWSTCSSTGSHFFDQWKIFEEIGYAFTWWLSLIVRWKLESVQGLQHLHLASSFLTGDSGFHFFKFSFLPNSVSLHFQIFLLTRKIQLQPNSLSNDLKLHYAAM